MLGVQLLKGNTLYGAIGFTPLANVPDRVFLYNKASGKEQYYIAAYFALISNLIY